MVPSYFADTVKGLHGALLFCRYSQGSTWCPLTLQIRPRKFMVHTYPAETVEPVHAAHVPPGEVVFAGVVTKQELVDALKTV
jgi:hypothetical protein